MSEKVNSQCPLAWPLGRPRTPREKIARARFYMGSSGAAVTIPAALERLLPELRLMRAEQIVVSTNIPVGKSDGVPRTLRAEPDDRGVAVYFRLKNEPRCLACDKWDRVADNITAIANHVDAVRGILRWGTADVAQLFAGFKALTAAEAKKLWWEVLGFKDKPMVLGVVKNKWLELATKHHPDRGGNASQMADINAAWNEARSEFENV